MSKMRGQGPSLDPLSSKYPGDGRLGDNLLPKVKKDKNEEEVILLYENIKIGGGKMAGLAKDFIELADAQAISSSIYSKLVDFGVFTRSNGSEAEEVISKYLREGMPRHMKRHQKIILGQLSNSKLDQRFYPESPLDWIRLKHFMNTIDVSLIGLTDPITRNRIRAINRRHLRSLRMADHNVDPTRKLIEFVFSGSGPSKQRNIWLLLDGFEMGVFTFQDVETILLAFADNSTSLLLTPFTPQMQTTDNLTQNMGNSGDEQGDPQGMQKGELKAHDISEEKKYHGVKLYLNLLLHLILLHNDSVFENTDGEGRCLKPQELRYFFHSPEKMKLLKQVLLGPLIENRYLLVKELEDPECKHLYYTIFFMLMSYHHDPMVRSVEILETPNYKLIPPLIYNNFHHGPQHIQDKSEILNYNEIMKEATDLQTNYREHSKELQELRTLAFLMGKQTVLKFKNEFKTILEGNYSPQKLPKGAKDTPKPPQEHLLKDNFQARQKQVLEDAQSLENSQEQQQIVEQNYEILRSRLQGLLQKLLGYLNHHASDNTSVKDAFLESLSHHGLPHVLLLHASFLTSNWKFQTFRHLVRMIMTLLAKFYLAYLPARAHLFTFEKWDTFVRVSKFTQIDSMCLILQIVPGYQKALINSGGIAILMKHLSQTFRTLSVNVGDPGQDMAEEKQVDVPPLGSTPQYSRTSKLATLNLILVIFNRLLDTDETSSKDQLGLVKKLAIQIQYLVFKQVETFVLPILSDPAKLNTFTHDAITMQDEKVLAYYLHKDGADTNEYKEAWLFVFLLLKTFNNTCRHVSVSLNSKSSDYGIAIDLSRVGTYFAAPEGGLRLGSGIIGGLLRQSSAVVAEPTVPVFLAKFGHLNQLKSGPFYLGELVQMYSTYNISNIAVLTRGLEVPTNEVIFNYYRVSAEVLCGILQLHRQYIEKFAIDEEHRNEAPDAPPSIGKRALCYLLCRGQIEPLYKFMKGASLHLTVEQLKTSGIVWQVCKALFDSVDTSPVHVKYLYRFKSLKEDAAKLKLNENNEMGLRLLKSASTMMLNIDKSEKEGHSEPLLESKEAGSGDSEPRVVGSHRQSGLYRLKVKDKVTKTFELGEKDGLMEHFEKLLEKLREASQSIGNDGLLSKNECDQAFYHYQKDTYINLREKPSNGWLKFCSEGNWNLEDLKSTMKETFDRYCSPESDEDLDAYFKEVDEITQGLRYPVECMVNSYLVSKKAQIQRKDPEKKNHFSKVNLNETKDHQPQYRSVYEELSTVTDDSAQTYFLIIAYWAMKDLYLLQHHTSSKKLMKKDSELLPGVPSYVSKPDAFFTQTDLIGMVELFDNILIMDVGENNIRKLVHDMFFGTDEEEMESYEDEKEKKHELPHQIGTGGLKCILQTCIALQRTILKETFDVHEQLHSGLYFRLCFLLKSLVEENFTQMKTVIKQLKHEESNREHETHNLLGAFMAGLALPTKISEEVTVTSLQPSDRIDLVWYNYVTILTLSECVFGVEDSVQVSSDKIISMLKQMNTICVDVNNPAVLVKERLSVLIGFLFEGTTDLLKNLYEQDRLNEMIKPRIMFEQIVKVVSLLLFSRDEIPPLKDSKNKPDDEDEEAHLSEEPTVASIYRALERATQWTSPKQTNPVWVNEDSYLIYMNFDQIVGQQEPEEIDPKCTREQFNHMQLGWAKHKRFLRKLANMRLFVSSTVEKEFNDYDIMEEFSCPRDILAECYIPRPEIATHRLLSTARMVYSTMKLISKSQSSREFKVFLTSTEYNVAKTSGDTATLNLFQSTPALMQFVKVFQSSDHKKELEEQPGLFRTLINLSFGSPAWELDSVIFGFLKLVSGSVEVRTELSKTTLVDFPILPCCFFISEQTKIDFTENVTIGDHGGRLVDMMESISHFEIEAKINMSINKRSPLLERIVSLDSFKIMMWISWIMSLGLNILALIFLDFSRYTDRTYQFEEEWYWSILNIGNIMLIVYSLFMACIYLIVRSTENYQKRTKRVFDAIYSSKQTTLKKVFLYVWAILKDIIKYQDVVVFCFSNIVFSGLFLLDSSYFLPFHMLLFASLSKTAKYIIRSITLHVDQLLFTLLLVMIVVYSYTMLIGLYFKSAFSPDATNEIQVCDNLLSCYCYVLDLGLRNGGGVGDSMVNVQFGDGFFYGKFLMTVTFFIFVNLVSLNIIFGIIIDTFAELRKQLEEREDEDYRACFICGIDRKDFEKKDKSFDYHKAVEHNLWNYVYFIIYLNNLVKLDMTGVESHVFGKLESKSPEWIPRNGTVFLSEQTNEGVSDMETHVQKVSDRVESIKYSINILEKELEKLVRPLKAGDSPIHSPPKVDETKQQPRLLDFKTVIEQEATKLRAAIQDKTKTSKTKLESVSSQRKDKQDKLMVKMQELLK